MSKPAYSGVNRGDILAMMYFDGGVPEEIQHAAIVATAEHFGCQLEHGGKIGEDNTCIAALLPVSRVVHFNGTSELFSLCN